MVVSCSHTEWAMQRCPTRITSPEERVRVGTHWWAVRMRYALPRYIQRSCGSSAISQHGTYDVLLGSCQALACRDDIRV